MDNLISKQAAIEAICKACSMVEDYHKCDYYPETSVLLCDELVALRELPSAQPEQVCVANVTLTDEQVKEAVEKAKNAVISVIEPEPCWIPCSERLPEKMGYYLISNEYKVVHEDYYWGSGCFEKAKKYQCEVEAWMPMPIPPYYGGNGE